MMNLTDDIEFVPPPECPVFEPSEEEFADAFSFIAKLRPVAEKTGIVKIRPPSRWQPPFAVDLDRFKFVPRIQRLADLEARTRVKLLYIEKVAKFWQCQGITFKIPWINGKLLDIYTLNKKVLASGGYDSVTQNRGWPKIALSMGYTAEQKHLAYTLRQNYEKWFYPYDLFKSGISLDPDIESKMKKSKLHQELKLEIGGCGKKMALAAAASSSSSSSTAAPTTTAVTSSNDSPIPGAAKVSESPSSAAATQSTTDATGGDGAPRSAISPGGTNSELKRLTFMGAGPKMALPSFSSFVKDEGDVRESPVKAEAKTVGTRRRAQASNDESDQNEYYCHSCSRGDGEDKMLLCDKCDTAYHTYCLIPPLNDVPRGDWCCPNCVAIALNQPLDPFGFEQSNKEYSLQSFGEKADLFKANYFKMPVHMVSCQQVEKEFWRLLSHPEEEVVVEYGADVHAAQVGSGFPTDSTRHTTHQADDDIDQYISSCWNLNNLPVRPKSVLCHINADITGMKVPWCYVGMCFSAFCWHVEDHWSYSINYMHWGEPKTWYGVPASGAEKLESVMKEYAGELFEESPDLLHQLTTTLSPAILVKHGVPVVRTNQVAGEFVITFPRSYHAGFNQGYNFAEAVNFCPYDWMAMGRQCIEHYRGLGRQCVFSHEELVCKMAADPEKLDLLMAAATEQELTSIMETESRLRRRLLDIGVKHAEREAFELLADDERQCLSCKSTCFLSALSCTCNPDLVVCLHHVEKLCSKCNDPSNYYLRFRYTLDELPSMLNKLRKSAAKFDMWAGRLKKAIQQSKETDPLERPAVEELQSLVKEAKENDFPETDFFRVFRTSVAEAEKCARVASQLVKNMERTRTRQRTAAAATQNSSNNSSSQTERIASNRLNFDDLRNFVHQLKKLPCAITGLDKLKALVDKAMQFRDDSSNILKLDISTDQLPQIEELLTIANELDLILPEQSKLEQRLKQVQWLVRIDEQFANEDKIPPDSLESLISDGGQLASFPSIEKALVQLRTILAKSKQVDIRANDLLKPSESKPTLRTIHQVLHEAKVLPVSLESVASLQELVNQAETWLAKHRSMMEDEYYPYLDVLESILANGHAMPFQLDPLSHMEEVIKNAKQWLERASRTFLRKDSRFTLLQVLQARHIQSASSARKRRRKSKSQLARSAGAEADGTTADGSAADDGDKEKYVAHSSMGKITATGAVMSSSEDHTPSSQDVDLHLKCDYKEDRRQERQYMWNIRRINQEKLNPAASDTYTPPTFCTCGKTGYGPMIDCDLCRNWFHVTCAPIHSSVSVKYSIQTNIKPNIRSPYAIEKASKYICGGCQRSKQPPMQLIIPLVVALKPLPVRILEGEAFICLTEYAMNWSDRVQQVLSTDDGSLRSAVSKLECHAKRVYHKLYEQPLQTSFSVSTNTTTSATYLSSNREMLPSTASNLHNQQPSAPERSIASVSPSSRRPQPASTTYLFNGDKSSAGLLQQKKNGEAAACAEKFSTKPSVVDSGIDVSMNVSDTTAPAAATSCGAEMGSWPPAAVDQESRTRGDSNDDLLSSANKVKKGDDDIECILVNKQKQPSPLAVGSAPQPSQALSSAKSSSSRQTATGLTDIVDEYICNELFASSSMGDVSAAGPTRRSPSGSTIGGGKTADEVLSKVMKVKEEAMLNDEALLGQSQTAPPMRLHASVSVHCADGRPSPTGIGATSLAAGGASSTAAGGVLPPMAEVVPMIVLPDVKRAQLDELLMEGLLLELGLPEIDQLWSLLKASEPPNARRLIKIPFSQPSLEEMNQELKRHRQSSSAAGADSHISTLYHSNSSGGSDKKKRKLDYSSGGGGRSLPSSHKQSSNSSSEGARHSSLHHHSPLSSPSSSTFKKKHNQPQQQQHVKGKKSSSVNTNGGDGAGGKTKSSRKSSSSRAKIWNDDTCASSLCIKPSGDEVDWIACDKCELWYHIVCEGLSKKQIDQKEDYLCKQCNLE